MVAGAWGPGAGGEAHSNTAKGMAWYSMSEKRERGGILEFQLDAVEAEQYSGKIHAKVSGESRTLRNDRELIIN